MIAFANELSAESLETLAEGAIKGIWHRGYHDLTLCSESIPRIDEAFARSDDRAACDGVRSLGPIVGYALGSEAEQRAYFASTAGFNRSMRVLFAPGLSPFDRLRLDLDELWPAGASLGRVARGRFAAGTLRRFTAGSRMNPHVDHKGGELLESLCSSRRIAANIYLEMPPEGGELEFWGHRLSEPELDALLTPELAIDVTRLGPPDVVIIPSIGDLVLFDTGYVHAVEPVRSGRRTTASCFIGVGGPGVGLSIFA